MMTKTNTATGELALRIGTRKTVLAVASIADAKQVINRLRDQMEVAGRGGASRFPNIRVINLCTGHTIGHASYNGRIWEGEPATWTPQTQELF